MKRMIPTQVEQNQLISMYTRIFSCGLSLSVCTARMCESFATGAGGGAGALCGCCDRF